MSTVLGGILPSTVAVAEAFVDPPEAVLLPEEEAVVAAAGDKRRREFTTVRHCARQALATLGRPPAPILPGRKGAPSWPAGVVGSMTHCAGYRAAALAEATQITSIGVDAEPSEPLPEGVLDIVARPAELAHLEALSRVAPELCWDRLLFTAKEAVYKTWFPLTGRWLSFEEAEIAFDPVAMTFVATLLVPGPVLGAGPVDRFHGRFAVANGLALAGIAIGLIH